MAVDRYEPIPGLSAEQDLSGAQFRAVEMSGDFQVDTCDNAGDICIGVLQDKPAAAGRAAEVAGIGLAKWESSAAIAVGDRVGTSANGRAVAKTANNDWFLGLAVTAAAGAGERITVWLTGGAFVGA